MYVSAVVAQWASWTYYITFSLTSTASYEYPTILNSVL